MKQTSVVLFILCCFVSASCARYLKPQIRSQIKSPKTGTQIETVGASETPASISSADASASLPLPKGSTVEVLPSSETSPGKISISLSEKSELKLTQKSETILGPKNYVPEAPPSVVELATAKGVELSYWLAGGLLLLCAGMAYTTHFKAAIIAGACAVIAPVLARFVSSVAGLIVIGGGLLVSGTLYFAWYLTRKNHVLAETKLETKVESTA